MSGAPLPLACKVACVRDTRVLLVHLSLVPMWDRCKLPSDLHVLPSLRARLGCPVARRDASCRAFCWAVGTAASTLASPGHGFLLHHSSRVVRAHADAVHAVTGCPVTPAHRCSAALFSIARVPVPQGESPVVLWGCCCSQMLDWLSPRQGQTPPQGNGCNRSCWGLARVSD